MIYQKIILCGRRCTGKTTLFWELQEILNWPVFSVSQYLRDYIRRHQLTKIEDINSHGESMGREIDNRVMRLVHEPNPALIDARVYAYIRESMPKTLKILLTASDGKRAERSALREGSTFEKAMNRMTKREAEWLIDIKERYGFDPLEYRWFDLVIDTTVLSPREVLIKTLLALGFDPNQVKLPA